MRICFVQGLGIERKEEAAIVVKTSCVTCSGHYSDRIPVASSQRQYFMIAASFK